MATHTSQVLVGRDAELTEIASLLGVRRVPEHERDRQQDRQQDRHQDRQRDQDRGQVRERAAVLLSGDAGVGKTRLLTELRDLAFTEGFAVFAGHCLDFGDSALPYLPFSEVLGRLATDLPAVVEQVAAAHPVLGRLQPGRRVLSAPAPGGAAAPRPTEQRDEGSALDRADLFEAVHTLLETVAASTPLLVVVEDVHWADQSTRDMLSFLFSRSFDGPVGLVASYRADDLHRRHPLRRQVAEWSRIRGVERVQLGPLATPDVRALIAELHPGTLTDAEIADIVDRAEGNAFFVEELVGAAAGQGHGTADLPEDLADVLLVRLDRLDDVARQVVRVASVAGRKVSHDLLDAASGLPAADLDEGLRRAVEMNVLVTGQGFYAFRHALLGEAVYDDLLPGERVRLHTAYVEALRSGAARGTAAELALHARAAMDLDTALGAGIQAGHEAMAVGGPDEAAQQFQLALELLADPRREPPADLDVSKLVVSAADALVAAGRPERAAKLVGEQLDRLPAAAPAAWRARMLSSRADALAVIETDEDALAVSAEALALLPEDAGGLRARVLAVHARLLTGRRRFEEAQPIAVEALALAEKLDLPQLASEAITTLSSMKKTGPVAGLRSALEDAVERARDSGALHAELRGRYLLAMSFQERGDFAAAEEWYRSGMDAAASAGAPWAPYGFEARWQLLWTMVVRGDWTQALALAEVAGENPPPIPRAVLESVRLYVDQGQGRDVSATTSRLRRFWGQEGSVAIHAAAVEMVAAGRAGDARAALGVYDDVVGVLCRIWHPWFTARIRLAATAIGAVAAAMPSLPAGERAEVVAEVDRLHAEGHTTLSRQADPAGHWGPEGRAWVKRLDAETLRARWLAGVDAPPREVLVDTWREAEAMFEEFGSVPDLAAVRVALAGILRATGDAAGAREVGDQAREAARRMDARALLEDLRASGSAPERGVETGPDTLTARETEILTLVAEGRSNGEIGRQLFISAKTVSVHVSNILGKLGAAGRTEAAAIARRRGLIG